MSITTQKAIVKKLYDSNTAFENSWGKKSVEYQHTLYNGFHEYGNYMAYTDGARLFFSFLDLKENKAKKQLDINAILMPYEAVYIIDKELYPDDVKKFIGTIKHNSEKGYEYKYYIYNGRKINTEYLIDGLKWCNCRKKEPCVIYLPKNENSYAPIKIVGCDGIAYIMWIK